MIREPMESAMALAGGGPFHRDVPGFTPRYAQQEMAAAVEEAISYGGKLVVESGTGTGKTFAYLAPVLMSGRRSIISTATRHLQEQIFHRDLPVASGALGKPVNAVLLKGRANYLCRYRLAQSAVQQTLVDTDGLRDFQAIDNWAGTTRTGDIAEITDVSEDSPAWKLATSTADNCLGAKCPDFDRCFVNKMRQRAQQADIVVVNHHLFFSDLTLKTEGFGELLPEHEVVVFDEAHAIPEIASNFFGKSTSSYQLRELMHDVQSAEKEEKSTVDFDLALSILGRAIDKLVKYASAFRKPSASLSEIRDRKWDDLVDELESGLENLRSSLETAATAGEGLSRCLERCLSIQDTLDTWRSVRDSKMVSWVEFSAGRFRLHVTPLSVSEHISSFVDNPGVAWIFTSATLAVGSSFDAFCTETGLQNADTRKWDSPYDFANNALLYLPAGLPDPRDDAYPSALTRIILDITTQSRGRAFCLFTSHAMMDFVHRQLGPVFEWPLFVQGQAPKQQLLNRFLEAENSVLLGTASFWEGVDVKGESLSCVIIDKLPFASPSDPVLRGKLEQCEASGGRPFMDIQIPAAVIALKQGAGRLIRSEQDQGVLAVCDPRVTGKPYGRYFLESLPPMPVTDSLGEVSAFFHSTARR